MSHTEGNGTGIALLDTEWAIIVNALMMAVIQLSLEADTPESVGPTYRTTARQHAEELHSLARRIAEAVG
jgi:hypothetical protein